MWGTGLSLEPGEASLTGKVERVIRPLADHCPKFETFDDWSSSAIVHRREGKIVSIDLREREQPTHQLHLLFSVHGTGEMASGCHRWWIASPAQYRSVRGFGDIRLPILLPVQHYRIPSSRLFLRFRFTSLRTGGHALDQNFV